MKLDVRLPDIRQLLPRAWFRYEFGLMWINGRWVSRTTVKRMLLLVAFSLLSGCHSVPVEQEREVIREAWSLLHQPAPDDAHWQAARAVWLDDATPWVGPDGRKGLPGRAP